MMEMNEWREVRLGEFIYTNKKNISKDYPHSKIKYLDTGSITCNRIEFLQDFELKDAPSRAKRLVEHDDIIYSSVRPNQLHYGYIKEPDNNLVVSTGFVTITCKKDKIYSLFLYYYLTQYSTTEYLHSIAEASTSAYPSLKPSDIEALDVTLPPLPEQKAIASVLSSLDDKIDLLHRQNETLEQMAEAMFRQWFVEEVDDSWEEVELGEIAEVKNGKSFKSSDFSEHTITSYEVVKMGHIEKGGGLKINPKKDYIERDDKLDRWVLSKGDIIMAMTDMKDNVVILGVPAMIDKDDHYILNQRVARIFLKDSSKLTSNYLLYCQLLNKDFIAELQTKANSGVQVNLSTDAIKTSKLVIPPIERQKEIDFQIVNIFELTEKNVIQINTLANLRDTLLPKLMSGEVRVEM